MRIIKLYAIMLIFIIPNITTAQKKQIDYERKIQELESRIKILEKQNSDLINLLSNGKNSNIPQKEKEYVVKFRLSVVLNGGYPINLKRDDSYLKQIVEDENKGLHDQYDTFFENLKTKNNLPYLQISNGYFEFDEKTIEYRAEIGFFESKQAAFEFATNNIPKNFSSDVISIHDPKYHPE